MYKCQNQTEMTVKIMVNKLTYYEYKVPEVLCTKISHGLFEKKIQTVGGVRGGGIACQVPDSYQPLATNKPLLALFSLFTNAITQLAAAIAIATDTLLASDCMQMTAISNQ